MIAGMIHSVIFPTDKCCKQSGTLLIAANLTSASLSSKRWEKVCTRLLSVISLPKDFEYSGKFLANESLTFHDLSSPAANKVPKV